MACGCNKRERNQVTSIEVVAMQEAERAAQAAADALVAAVVAMEGEAPPEASELRAS